MQEGGPVSSQLDLHVGLQQDSISHRTPNFSDYGFGAERRMDQTLETGVTACSVARHLEMILTSTNETHFGRFVTLPR